MGQKLKD